MTTDTIISRRRESSLVSGLVGYLLRGNGRGKEILVFSSSSEANEAARVLRSRDPGGEVHIEARYDKVFLSLAPKY